MHLYRKLRCGTSAEIIVRRDTEIRLFEKHFRGTSRPLAGNFMRWHSADRLFGDVGVMREFLAELNDLWLREDFATHSLCINHSAQVGWSSTDELKKYSAEALEAFDLNRRSHGLRVNLDRKDLRAPRTNKLTIVFEFKREGITAVAIVHSVYPGPDVGELNGDVSQREKCVFFDWDHPGA